MCMDFLANDFFLYGCGAAARESGFYEHSTMYKRCDPMKFSIDSYQEAIPDEAKQSNEDAWWGVAVK